MIPALIATIVSALACAGLVVAESRARHGKTARLVYKPLASAAFIAVPVAGGAVDGGIAAGSPATWIVAGLILGAIGDVLLLFESLFLAGLAVFLLGHVAYIVAFALTEPIAVWPQLARWQTMVVVAAGGTALAWLWPHLGSMRIPVVAYVVVIVMMVIGAAAVSAATAAQSHAAASLVILGATMFFASDLAVARDKFVAPGFVNRLWGLPVYYAAQLALGWSLLVA